MAIKKEKKVEIVSSLESILSKSKSVVFVNFHKLLVKDSSLLRRALKGENVGYVVSKKSLFERALGASSVKGEIPEIKGELSIAYGDDLLAPARGVYEFQKKLDGKVKIIGGIFDHEYKSEAEMLSIAMIPGMDTLRGMFVNIVNSPIQRFVIALGQVAEKKA